MGRLRPTEMQQARVVGSAGTLSAVSFGDRRVALDCSCLNTGSLRSFICCLVAVQAQAPKQALLKARLSMAPGAECRVS